MLLARRVITFHARIKKMTPEQAVDLENKRYSLRHRIAKWQEVQSVYMPAITELRANTDTNDASAHDGDESSALSAPRPESFQLYLPSGVPQHFWPSGSLVEKERRLRLAQADDALLELKRLLRVTLGLWHYKFTQLGPSQRANTRARSMIARYREKINRCAERYRAARCALLHLDPTGNWITRLKELRVEDVKGPRREDDESEGNRELSWIWFVQREAMGGSSENISPSEDEIGESKTHSDLCFTFNLISSGLRVEWAKARARKDRWSEEVILLVEEMRRVLCFFDWKAEWWLSRTKTRTDISEELREGLVACATKQASVLLTLANKFADMWHPRLSAFGIDAEWPEHYLHGREPVSFPTASEPVEDVDADDIDLDDDMFD
jgi:hypothetical protein